MGMIDADEHYRRVEDLNARVSDLEAAARGVLTVCREWRDKAPVFAKSVTPADFILWGKLFPPEALGPKCYEHAAKHIGYSGMSQIDQYAVVDLRPIREALGMELT